MRMRRVLVTSLPRLFLDLLRQTVASEPQVEIEQVTERQINIGLAGDDVDVLVTSLENSPQHDPFIQRFLQQHPFAQVICVNPTATEVKVVKLVLNKQVVGDLSIRLLRELVLEPNSWCSTARE